MSGRKTVNDVIVGFREQEIDQEHLGKRKEEQIQTVVGQAQRPRIQDSCLGDQRGRVSCTKCGRTYVGDCQDTGRGCFICRRMSCLGRDFPRESITLCFQCNLVGHKKTDCPELMRGAVRTLPPTTLRISDNREGREDVSMGRSRVLQSQAEGI